MASKAKKSVDRLCSLLPPKKRIFKLIGHKVNQWHVLKRSLEPLVKATQTQQHVALMQRFFSVETLDQLDLMAPTRMTSMLLMFVAAVATQNHRNQNKHSNWNHSLKMHWIHFDSFIEFQLPVTRKQTCHNVASWSSWSYHLLSHLSMRQVSVRVKWLRNTTYILRNRDFRNVKLMYVVNVVFLWFIMNAVWFLLLLTWFVWLFWFLALASRCLVTSSRSSSQMFHQEVAMWNKSLFSHETCFFAFWEVDQGDQTNFVGAMQFVRWKLHVVKGVARSPSPFSLKTRSAPSTWKRTWSPLLLSTEKRGERGDGLHCGCPFLRLQRRPWQTRASSRRRRLFFVVSPKHKFCPHIVSPRVLPRDEIHIVKTLLWKRLWPFVVTIVATQWLRKDGIEKTWSYDCYESEKEHFQVTNMTFTTSMTPLTAAQEDSDIINQLIVESSTTFNSLELCWTLLNDPHNIAKLHHNISYILTPAITEPSLIRHSVSRTNSFSFASKWHNRKLQNMKLRRCCIPVHLVQFF